MKLGNEMLYTNSAYDLLKNAAVGIMTNYTGMNTAFERTIDKLREKQIRITKLFAPEHGYYGIRKAGEVVMNEIDQKTGIHITSLYGAMSNMNATLLDGIEVLLVEIQDVGVRFYTYISTIFQMMNVANKVGIPVVILDRPNPLGGNLIEGPGVDSRYRSFVGIYDLPIRHGMTIGELALLYQQEQVPDLSLHIVKMEGWKRSCLFPETGLAWIPPSQNLPDDVTALLYPGTAFVEGLNVSEGRGTTMPFRWMGAPWMNGERWSSTLNELELPGVRFRPVLFKPTYSKHENVICEGVEIHITDKKSFVPTKTGLYIVQSIINLYPNNYKWVELEGKLFIDLLWGSSAYRHDLIKGRSVEDINQEWQAHADHFEKRRKPYLLYR